MCAKWTSAWLCADTAAVLDVCAGAAGDEAVSLVAVFPHAPIATAALSAATPVTTVFTIVLIVTVLIVVVLPFAPSVHFRPSEFPTPIGVFWSFCKDSTKEVEKRPPADW